MTHVPPWGLETWLQEPECAQWASHMGRACDFAADFALLWFLLSSGTFRAFVVKGDSKWHVAYSIVYSFSKMLCWNSAPSGWKHRAGGILEVLQGGSQTWLCIPLPPGAHLKKYIQIPAPPLLPQRFPSSSSGWGPPKSVFLKSP